MSKNGEEYSLTLKNITVIENVKKEKERFST